jgi:hypothetical protein
MSANEKLAVLSGAYRESCTVQAFVPHLREGGLHAHVVSP